MIDERTNKPLGVLYLPDLKAAQRIIRNLREFPPGLPLDLICHEKTKWPHGEVVVLPQFPPLKAGSGNRASDSYGTLAFLHSLRHAAKQKARWMFLVEHDCQFGRAGWLRELWAEHQLTGATHCSGTPVMWNAGGAGLEQQTCIHQLSQRVLMKTGIPPDIHHLQGGTFRVYPNGALAWYNVERISEMFTEGLKLISQTQSQRRNELLQAFCDEVQAFDFHIGSRLAAIDWPKALGILTGSYSGCGDHVMDEQARLRLLAHEKKLAVHQVKGDGKLKLNPKPPAPFFNGAVTTVEMHGKRSDSKTPVATIELPPPRQTRTISVLLTVHRRSKMAKEAYQSIIDAGFKPQQVVVVYTDDAATSIWARSLRSEQGVNTFSTSEGWGNNRQWLYGLERCKSSHVIILHDDDRMLPGLRKKLEERDDWEVAHWDAVKFGDSKDKISYFTAKAGVYHGGIIRHKLSEMDLTISTIQGCFPTGMVLKSLKEWSAKIFKPEHEIRKGMHVGNDLLLWFNASKSERVWIMREPFSACRQHSGSTTVRGLADKTITGIYQSVRTALGLRPANVCVIGHLSRNQNHASFLRDLEKSHPGVRTILMSPQNAYLPRWIENIVVDDLDGTEIAPDWRYRASDQYGAYAFANACQIAVDDGCDQMLYIESDCRFGRPGWGSVLVEEAAGSAKAPLVSGTPVLWGGDHASDREVEKLDRYVSAYEAAVPWKIAREGNEGIEGVLLFTNGALSVYSREAMETVFVERLRRNGLSAFLGSPPFDVMMGRDLMRMHGPAAIDRIQWIRSSYSGCSNHWYSQEQRLEWLDSGVAVAIHQVKEEA